MKELIQKYCAKSHMHYWRNDGNLPQILNSQNDAIYDGKNNKFKFITFGDHPPDNPHHPNGQYRKDNAIKLKILF